MILGYFEKARYPAALFNYFMYTATIFNCFTPPVYSIAIFDAPFRFIFFMSQDFSPRKICSWIAKNKEKISSHIRVKVWNLSVSRPKKRKKSRTSPIDSGKNLEICLSIAWKKLFSFTSKSQGKKSGISLTVHRKKIMKIFDWSLKNPRLSSINQRKNSKFVN